MAVSENRPIPSWRRDLLWLTLAFAILFFFRLGSSPLRNPDEGRNAEIAREMVASGDWVTPRLNGVNYFEKPPLVYWMNAIALKAFGPNEWAMRATPALFALAGVLITYAAGRRLYGRVAGLAAAVVLGTSMLYAIMAQILLLDMAMSVLMAATLFCFILGVREPAESRARRWFFYGLYVSAALATLTKGLMGFLVTGAAMFLWLLIFNQWRRLRPLYLPTGVLLFLVIAAPWHILAAQQNETWVHRYLVYEHFLRFLTPAADKPGAWWYFFPVLLVGLFPWIGFLWPAAREALAGGWKRRGENAEAWFLVVWSAFVFFFFSISKSKLPPYILPIFPALAVLIGVWLARIVEAGRPGALRGGLRVFAFVCGLLGAAFAVLVVRPELAKLSAEHAALIRPSIIAMVLVLLGGGVVALWLAKSRGALAAAGTVVVTIGLFFVGVKSAPLDKVVKPGTKELALIVKQQAKSGDRVLHYHGFFHDFTFYAGRVVDTVAFQGELELEEDAAARASGRFIDQEAFLKLWNGPQRLFVVARKRDVETRPNGEPRLFSDPTFRYHLIADTGYHTLFSNQP